ncbi:MAG: FAD:protein FMN transferase [Prevotellaceae bacterium]|jgi:thiamine biosynthesis lipoprotein|nr:FAD:protein FMN transferase [Prevotellaceae bacterium]
MNMQYLRHNKRTAVFERIKKYLKLLPLLTVILLVSCKGKPVTVPEYLTVTHDYITLRGFALGTYFKVSYKDDKKRDYYDSIKKILNEFENSLSIYRENSIISKVNRNEPVELDSYFITVFNCAKEISEKTNGAFDISASPIFEIWGWGAKERVPVTPELIDSLKQFVGMDKIHVSGRKIIKDNPHVTLNINAIAKGYSSDVVALFLERHGIGDYLVEIGGEIVVKGKNKDGNNWQIGIEKPADGNMIPGEALQAIINIRDKAVATSGDYRKFYVENGKKYAHTIDPKTGYPAKKNILSASVVANDCMTADALATAFMVMGLDDTKKFTEQYPDIEVFLIYTDENNEIKEYCSDNMKNRFVEIKQN